MARENAHLSGLNNNNHNHKFISVIDYYIGILNKIILTCSFGFCLSPHCHPAPCSRTETGGTKRGCNLIFQKLKSGHLGAVCPKLRDESGTVELRVSPGVSPALSAGRTSLGE